MMAILIGISLHCMLFNSTKSRSLLAIDMSYIFEASVMACGSRPDETWISVAELIRHGWLISTILIVLTRMMTPGLSS
jgi:hypothetical protein